MEEKCEWRPDSDDWVDENCWNACGGNMFVFNDGGPFENGFKYCPYCGKEIEEDC